MVDINFTPFPNLRTDCLVLRKVQVEDENEFFILKSDEEILKYLDAKAKTFDEARKFLRKINEGIAENEWILWGITLTNENKLIGTICLWNISREYSRAEIGYELMPAYQGRGIMQEAATAVIEYGFKSMKLQSIVAFPNPNNLRSIRLLERHNFGKKNLKRDDLSEETIYLLENPLY